MPWNRSFYPPSRSPIASLVSIVPPAYPSIHPSPYPESAGLLWGPSGLSGGIFSNLFGAHAVVSFNGLKASQEISEALERPQSIANDREHTKKFSKDFGKLFLYRGINFVYS